MHPDEIQNSAHNPLRTHLTAIRGGVDFFLRLNSLLGFQTLLRFPTLSPKQHLLHMKNVTNLEFLLIANAASYNFKFSGIGCSLPRPDLICLALGNWETHCFYGVLLKPIWLKCLAYKPYKEQPKQKFCSKKLVDSFLIQLSERQNCTTWFAELLAFIKGFIGILLPDFRYNQMFPWLPWNANWLAAQHEWWKYVLHLTNLQLKSNLKRLSDLV